ncbi:hypothetical protein MARCHEWKA_03530 [Brevundimonas phage vB_BpoS-Marchewka]|uniref:Uncharacterized protein n=1 Tax=Brevundimonas phage vB_BpoS-Marchewka TaxID=2948604 RepID=A0A9E7ST97_9CAUD|nr:hypothetical protein MARCHEWKA_03530 [Brevundimonas phage vB_BpoS-Marchewka]UTC29311.1 hypothetical protein BAMBUS_02290 [Brevundimonas phage vB_BpoS-Bambus]
MAIVTTVSSVSYRYYEKRNRSVAEQNIQSMCRALDKSPPPYAELRALAKDALIRLALSLHNEFPEET